jgi:hypothetical protein
MLRIGAIVRLLMLAVCLMTFISQRQVVDAFALSIPLAPIAPTSETPVEGEDDEREERAKEHPAASAKHRPVFRELYATLPPGFATHPTRFARVRVSPPVAVDPFCNGLGSTYRC